MNSQTKPAPCTASIENDHTHGRQHCTRPAGHTDSHASPPIAGEGIAGQAGRIYWDDAYVGAVPHQPAAVSAAVAPPTNHGLSVQHADALYDAIATPGPGERESFDDQHARVCRVVREILDELTPTPAEPTNETAAEAALAAVETALGDTLLPAAREEALAGITAVLPSTTDRAAEPVCICGHPNERHFEDVCQTCGCGDYLEPQDAAEVIARWRQAALKARADRAAVLTEPERKMLAFALEITQEEIHARSLDLADDDKAALVSLRRMADETATETPKDTLPAWLYQRFMPDGTGWDHLDEDDRSYWQHQARAVRRAVARGGFKQPPAGARQDGAQP